MSVEAVLRVVGVLIDLVGPGLFVGGEDPSAAIDVSAVGSLVAVHQVVDTSSAELISLLDAHLPCAASNISSDTAAEDNGVK